MLATGAIICMPEMRNRILASATVLSTFAFALSFALVLVTGNWPRARVSGVAAPARPRC